MKSGRAAAWAARSASSSSSSHLAAISGSGSPRRLPRPLSPPLPPPPPAVPPFLFPRLLSSCLSVSLTPSSSSLPRLSLLSSSSSRRNLRHWKTRLDSEFIKMHTANSRIRPEYPPSFRELYFGSATVTADRRREIADDGETSSPWTARTQWKGQGNPGDDSSLSLSSRYRSCCDIEHGVVGKGGETVVTRLIGLIFKTSCLSNRPHCLRA